MRPQKDQFQNSSIDAVVSCYSDIGGGGDLEIDISILKNAVAPMSDREKAELKQKYGVKSQEPVLVIGYASPSSDVSKVVEAASKYATVYLVGYGKKDDYHLSPQTKAKVHVVDKHGVLKDYYAMADVAINANNLHHSSMPLHNFVEATEGGPLFMVPSTNTAQYGYRQLVNSGVIMECDGLDDLVGKVEGFLRNFGGNARVINARARHLVQSRENYLPVILAKIMQLAGEDTPLPDSDLNITQNGRGVRIMHPDSDWGFDSAFNNESFLYIKRFPKNEYNIYNFEDKIFFEENITTKYLNSRRPLFGDDKIKSYNFYSSNPDKFEKRIFYEMPTKKRKPTSGNSFGSDAFGEFPENFGGTPINPKNMILEGKRIPSDILVH